MTLHIPAVLRRMIPRVVPDKLLEVADLLIGPAEVSQAADAQGEPEADAA